MDAQTLQATSGVVGTVLGALITGVIGQRILARKDREIASLAREKDLRIAEITREKDLEIARLKVGQELQIEFDRDLRTRRIEQYEKLWAAMKPLAKYPASGPMSYMELGTLSILFRNWYFAGGGLILSDKTRESYFNLQDGSKVISQKQEQAWPPDLGSTDLDRLRRYLDREDGWKAPPELLKLADSPLSKTGYPPPQASDTLSPEIFELLRKLGSTLRTSMTEDVLTRRPAYLSTKSS